jgi:hypothetical protein
MPVKMKAANIFQQKRRHISNWKMRGTFIDKIAANTINKQIRQTIYDNKKCKIRKQIKPGNSKSLWDAVKIAREQDMAPISNKMA